MKKAISLFLSIIMLCALAISTHVEAAETEIKAGSSVDDAVEISFNTEYTSRLKSSQTAHWYKFTTPADAYYNFYYGEYGGSRKTLKLCTKSGKILDESSQYHEEYYVCAELKANETYYLKISTVANYHDENAFEPGNYGFCVSYKEDAEGIGFNDAYSLELNKKNTYELDGIGDKDYFVFRGEKGVKYQFDFINISGGNNYIHKNCKVYGDDMDKIDELYTAKGSDSSIDSLTSNSYDTYYFEVYYTNVGNVLNFSDPYEYSITVSTVNDNSSATGQSNYRDVPAGSYGEDSIMLLSNYGIIQGDNNGNFNPNNRLTRAEAARILCMMLKEKNLDTNVSTDFYDVSYSHWASAEISAMAKRGIIHGYGNGLFGPEDYVTGHQLLTLLVNAAGHEGEAISLGGFPYGHAAIASELGYLTGINGVDLTQPINRATVAIIVANAVESDAFAYLWK